MLKANILHYREIQVIGTVAQSECDGTTALRVLNDNSARFNVLCTEIMPASHPGEAFERAIRSTS